MGPTVWFISAGGSFQFPNHLLSKTVHKWDSTTVESINSCTDRIHRFVLQTKSVLASELFEHTHLLIKHQTRQEKETYLVQVLPSALVPKFNSFERFYNKLSVVVKNTLYRELGVNLFTSFCLMLLYSWNTSALHCWEINGFLSAQSGICVFSIFWVCPVFKSLLLILKLRPQSDFIVFGLFLYFQTKA